MCRKLAGNISRRAGAPHHYLATMEEGWCRIVADDTVIEVHAGEAFYIPMGLGYQSYWYADKNIHFYSYGFDYFPGLAAYRLQKLPPEAYETVRNIPLADVPDAAALGALYTVLGRLIPDMEEVSLHGHSGLVQRAVEYMALNPGCSVPDAARHCSVSESTLYAAFRSEIGETPNDMRLQLLAERAVKLLTTTSGSVQQISDRLGFCSTDYFRRILKKYTGMSPRQIRSGAILP